RLVNLAAAEGHPAAVMGMSFADQALTCAWLATAHSSLSPAVHDVPKEIDTEVARLKLASMSISIDELSKDQEDYLHSWRIGSLCRPASTSTWRRALKSTSSARRGRADGGTRPGAPMVSAWT